MGANSLQLRILLFLIYLSFDFTVFFLIIFIFNDCINIFYWFWFLSFFKNVFYKTKKFLFHLVFLFHFSFKFNIFQLYLEQIIHDACLKFFFFCVKRFFLFHFLPKETVFFFLAENIFFYFLNKNLSDRSFFRKWIFNYNQTHWSAKINFIPLATYI